LFSFHFISFHFIELELELDNNNNDTYVYVVDVSCFRLERERNEVFSTDLLEEEICCAGVAITSEDFDKAISHLQSQQHSFKFGAPKVTLETTKSK
jgi:hypothetical protein